MAATCSENQDTVAWQGPGLDARLRLALAVPMPAGLRERLLRIPDGDAVTGEVAAPEVAAAGSANAEGPGQASAAVDRADATNGPVEFSRSRARNRPASDTCT